MQYSDATHIAKVIVKLIYSCIYAAQGRSVRPVEDAEEELANAIYNAFQEEQED